MITFKQFIAEDINDDDFYLADSESKTLLRSLGPRVTPWNQDQHIKDSKHIVIRGLKAKMQGFTLKKD